jgi:hypothetical protein
MPRITSWLIDCLRQQHRALLRLAQVCQSARLDGDEFNGSGRRRQRQL